MFKQHTVDEVAVGEVIGAGANFKTMTVITGNASARQDRKAIEYAMELFTREYYLRNRPETQDFNLLFAGDYSDDDRAFLSEVVDEASIDMSKNTGGMTSSVRIHTIDPINPVQPEGLYGPKESDEREGVPTYTTSCLYTIGIVDLGDFSTDAVAVISQHCHHVILLLSREECPEKNIMSIERFKKIDTGCFITNWMFQRCQHHHDYVNICNKTPMVQPGLPNDNVILHAICNHLMTHSSISQF